MTGENDEVSLSDVQHKKETFEEKSLRQLRQLWDFCSSCSICRLGSKLQERNGQKFDPHVFSNMKPSKWVIVGQNPGYNECLEHEPFVGDAGKFFNKTLEEFGLSRDKFYITNAVHCFTPNNRKPENDEVENCIDFLRFELKILKPKLVITLGAVSFGYLCPQETYSDSLGKIVKSKVVGYPVYPIYHPSPRNMSAQNRKIKFRKDMQNLCKLIQAYEKQSKIIKL